MDSVPYKLLVERERLHEYRYLHGTTRTCNRERYDTVRIERQKITCTHTTHTHMGMQNGGAPNRERSRSSFFLRLALVVVAITIAAIVIVSSSSTNATLGFVRQGLQLRGSLLYKVLGHGLEFIGKDAVNDISLVGFSTHALYDERKRKTEQRITC